MDSSSDSNIILIVLLAVAVIFIIALLISKQKFVETTQKTAEAKLEGWKQRELEMLRYTEARAAKADAKMELEVWKQDSEFFFRQDAINRSRSVITGQVTEHLIPHFPSFPYNPKDVRFIGSPIDLIVFDGMTEGNLKAIIFLEVKTGKSALNARQRSIRDVVGVSETIQFRVMNIPTNVPVAEVLEPVQPSKPVGTVVYDEDGYDEHGYDEDGYDECGYDRNGLDEDGYPNDGTLRS